MTNATRPDVDSLITGGQVRRRRRNITWIGGAAAALVLVGGGVYVGTQLDGGDDGDIKTATQTETSAPPSEPVSVPPYVDTGVPLAPGTYRKLVGIDDAGSTIRADITFEGPGWNAGGEPTVLDGEDWAGLAVYVPDGLASGSGCESDPLNRDLGQTPVRLAAQLARLPGSEVVEPPTSTRAFGLDALHLRVQIDNQCRDADPYILATNFAGSHGINYSGAPSLVDIDFWVVDVDGTPVVVEVFRDDETPAGLLRRATSARDSISFVTEEE